MPRIKKLHEDVLFIETARDLSRADREVDDLTNRSAERLNVVLDQANEALFAVQALQLRGIIEKPTEL